MLWCRLGLGLSDVDASCMHACNEMIHHLVIYHLDEMTFPVLSQQQFKGMPNNYVRFIPTSQVLYC